MNLRTSAARRLVALALTPCAMGLLLSPSTASAQGKFFVTPVAEKKLKQLPAGPLYWRLENFSTLTQAEAAAGETSLAAEVAGKIWLFTLGRKGGSTPGSSKVASRLGLCPRSLRPSICCASTMPVVHPRPRRRCIRTPALRPSTCWPAGWAKGLRTA
jgi:hypothetical protein